jgi:hypothetical protein
VSLVNGFAVILSCVCGDGGAGTTRYDMIFSPLLKNITCQNLEGPLLSLYFLLIRFRFWETGMDAWMDGQVVGGYLVWDGIGKWGWRWAFGLVMTDEFIPCLLCFAQIYNHNY